MRKVLTVYDMVWHYFPETMDWYNRAVLKILAKRSISLADHIVTISKATAQSLNEVLGVPLNRITVAYPAADDYTVFDKRASGAYIAENYGVSRNYILTVSTVEPRKNLVALLRSFSPIRREGFQLVIAGAMGWKNSPLSEEIARLGFSDDEVRFLGFVPDADMNKLYCGAQLFVFPSLYEGFGIPPLEAMASGTPVIASWSSSLPEVVGEAGTLLDPNDIDCWTEAVLQTMRDESLRGRMAADGVNQARNFSWHATARNVMDAFHAGASC
jgi:glycosyltransferase involved in cell wall biosynthesis